jgi:hypothetical protein
MGSPDDDERPTMAEMAQLVAMLQDTGLVEVFMDDEGREAYRLTPEGVRVGHLLAVGDAADTDEVLAALLDGAGE